jgi:hypothetical protein
MNHLDYLFSGDDVKRYTCNRCDRRVSYSELILYINMESSEAPNSVVCKSCYRDMKIDDVIGGEEERG